MSVQLSRGLSGVFLALWIIFSAGICFGDGSSSQIFDFDVVGETEIPASAFGNSIQDGEYGSVEILPSVFLKRTKVPFSLASDSYSSMNSLSIRSMK